mmetsp:Transcript_22752/g.37677  ORF Transcript_22752/g.37677 Transcript_22752/m.37677 type:complete len:589 (+) Transcript_22752:165-1931(+)
MRGLKQPRHPSLDNLRRPGPQQHATSRSYPQLPISDRSNNNNNNSSGDQEEESAFQTIVGALCAAAALGCFTGLFLLLVILYMTIRPFSQSFYRRLAASMGAASFLDAMTLLLPNLRLCLTGDSDVPSPVGTSVLVCNHMLDGQDWWAILMLGRCVGLRGSLKVFLRNECLQLQPQKRNSQTSSNGSHSTGSANGTPTASNGTASSPLLMTRSESASAQLLPNEPNKTVTFVGGRNTASSSNINGSYGNGGGTNGTPTRNSGGSSSGTGRKASFLVSLTAQMLHTLLDFPILSSNENNYIEDREDLFSLLKSFAHTQGAGTPVHLLLFPEGWSLHGSNDRKAVLAKSNEFAKREGRPQLKHLLLPRTTGFNASLESLRESSPVVYDVTLAYRGYDGSFVSQRVGGDVTLATLWNILRKPREMHIRIKRYSMEEVLQDASWLDKQWAEKDRLLSHFSRHQQFPTDSRGYFGKHRVFDTRQHAVENSVLALARLLIIPLFVPILLLLSIPIFWIVLWMWIFYKSYKILMGLPADESDRRGDNGDVHDARTVMVQTPGSATGSAAGTPFFPATPFGSPSISNWSDIGGGNK